MIKNVLILFFITSVAGQAIAQQVISGKVTDLKGNPLPYVNIGIKGGKTGTVSNREGVYTLTFPDEFLKDSITFSCIGFQEKAYIGSDLSGKKNMKIMLTEKVALLKEVTISNVKRKTRKLGITGRTPMISIPTSSLTSTDIFEQARLIHLPSPAKILNANIFLISDDAREVTIRVNFYGFKNGQPTERLIEKNIVKQKVIKKGWLTIDLSDQDIYIDNDFVVSFEYLPNSTTDNKRIVFGAKLGASDSWLRSNSLGVWRKNELGGATMYVTAEM